MTRRLPLLALLACLLPATAPAYQWRMGDTTNQLVLAAGDRLAEETVWAANSVDIQGEAERDLWLLSPALVRFDGKANGDLRLFANSAVLNGAAQQNVFAYAKGLQFTTNSSVGGELAAFGASIICEGTVASDAWIFAQSATLGGHWGGNVHIYADEIRLAPGTTIAGDVIYSAARPLAYDATVSIGGTVTERKGQLPEANALTPATLRPRLMLNGYLFLSALLVGMPFVGLFPLAAGGAVRKLRSAPGRALGAGVIAVFTGPFLILFAIMTVVGIPLALLLGALYVAVLYLSHIIVALWLGHLLLRAPGPQTFARVLSALALGLFLLYFLAAIPGFAMFIAVPVALFGGGAFVLGLLQRPYLPVPIPPPAPPSPKTPENPEKPE